MYLLFMLPNDDGTHDHADHDDDDNDEVCENADNDSDEKPVSIHADACNSSKCQHRGSLRSQYQ